MKKWPLLAVACVCSLSACRGPGAAISQLSGHYEGSLLTHLGGTTQQTPVSTDIEQLASHQYVVKDEAGTTQLSLTLANFTASTVSIQSSVLLPQATTLSCDFQQSCCSSKADTPGSFKVTLCATAPSISFEIDDATGASLLSLSLYRFAPEAAPTAQEAPRTFTLSAAIDRARNTSFQARVEFEHVIQAKERAKAAYLHLLPQLTIGTLALQPTFSSVLTEISDLAPFLLPSRWIQAHEASARSRAEQDADRIMKLDMGSEVEGLFYSYDRDRQSLAAYTASAQKVTAIYGEVLKLEAAGELPLGSADNIQAVRLNLERSIDIFNQVLTEDRAALAQSLGFLSPLAVQDAVIDQEAFPIDNAPAVDFQTINDAALARSFELDQMDWLISAARFAKVAMYFDWLDPAGNPNLGLGPALPAQIQVAQSQLRELAVDRDEFKSILSEKAFNAVTDYDQALKDYALQKESATLQTRRLEETLSQLDAGVRIEIATLLDVLNDYTNNLIETEIARANYRVARAEIDRLLLQGFYAKF